MNLTPNSMQSSRRQMIILAPTLYGVSDGFSRAAVNAADHETLLASMQRLRGSVYLSDGAIEPWQLTEDGRHRLAVDDHSWHVLTLDKSGEVSGCSRFRPHERGASFWNMDVAKSSMASCPQWGKMLKAAIENEMTEARQARIAFGEVGGWALSEDLRCTTEALRIALATYSLVQLFGGGLSVTTATVRNCSSSILKRIGGAPLDIAGQELPKYYDPQYRCDMEILRFDSRNPKPRFREWIENIKSDMETVPVICAEHGWMTDRFEAVAAYESRPETVLLPKIA